MDFNYEQEENKLILANENIKNVIKNYNNFLLTLDDREKNIIELYYRFKNLNTITNMTPKENYEESERKKCISMLTNYIKTIGNKVYPEIANIEELKTNVINDMNGKLIDVSNNFSTSIKNAYKKYCKYVYTILPISGLTELIGSKHRENQYYNSISDGIFSTTTMESIQKYIARANVGGMIVNGNEIRYPLNPFLSVDDSKLNLIKPVSIYLANADYFEPQIDYHIDSEGKPYFKYGGEWVSTKEKVTCIENRTRYLPSSFLEDNVVFYYENGKKINIYKTR